MTVTAEAETQECINCGEEKPLDAFAPNTIYGGHKSTCRECMAAKVRNHGGGPRGYVDTDVSDSTTRKERHEIAGVAPLTDDERRAVEQATKNMLNHTTDRRGERAPEPMAPIDELLKAGTITEPRMWYLCDRALQDREKVLEKRKAG